MLSPFRRGPFEILSGQWTLDTSPIFLTFDLMARIFLPYDLNPHGANPLRDILADCIDTELLANAPIKLFVTATNVRTGRGRVFGNAEVTPDVLLASACLPTLFQAVEIDGEAYWDGGYAGNPTITPLIRECSSSDTILVQVNPVERKGTPRSAREIINRVNEVSFNATLMKELRMIPFCGRSQTRATAKEHGGPKCESIASQAMRWQNSATLRSSMRNGSFSACCATRDGAQRKRSLVRIGQISAFARPSSSMTFYDGLLI